MGNMMTLKGGHDTKPLREQFSLLMIGTTPVSKPVSGGHERESRQERSTNAWGYTGEKNLASPGDNI